ncbi:MAG: hypothetical protein A3E98_03035 [Candidatus Doudnabacteria bacterium RIFCSPHIGHO2_12_FULL_48_11]|uniref:RNA polymerase subunit sigma-24 n=1 Tax=Candidatus Doudnabacteria bacterium RIFCSPHIGHO2_01_FULL_46_24 TaxID=1817825 RepID=A0A1F5NTI5_9BACT|nr:MAG: hypothetical protein A2720_03680 [Candidatus Doudnabacteria bacterium RIFCSPHIGHO2_01_FULL_46_24]OGE96015.1 MAG: hypothetical protein A3E98_03035 [Candidatus Doudnabacteria bacterium RIFCSPHIGHO2_12_FULL_48_11]
MVLAAEAAEAGDLAKIVTILRFIRITIWNSMESDIAKQCQMGNWSNFDELYEVYLPKIYAFVYNRVRHKQTAEDIVSTVFTNIVKRVGTFREHGAGFKPWVYAIARNALIDHYRRNQPTFDIGSVEVVSGENLANGLDRALDAESVKQFLAALQPQQREIILLRIWDDLSHKEIAQILNVSEANSKVMFSRAISSLRQALIGAKP